MNDNQRQTPDDLKSLSSDSEPSNRDPGSGPGTASETVEPEEEPKNDILHTILEYAGSIVIAIVAALLITNFILFNARIPSGSMQNTIMKGDRVFGFRLAYMFSEPKRGDIVIFKWPDDESVTYIKRVIGLPGETVTIRGGKVYINDSDTPLDEPYLAETPYDRDYGPYVVPENCYFMLGDNRNNSKDSRLWENTFVTKDEILAKAFFKYWKGFKWFGDQTYD